MERYTHLYIVGSEEELEGTLKLFGMNQGGGYLQSSKGATYKGEGRVPGNRKGWVVK